jgi:hypothetical protein
MSPCTPLAPYAPRGPLRAASFCFMVAWCSTLSISGSIASPGAVPEGPVESSECIAKRTCRKVATLSSVACKRNLRSATSRRSSKTKSYRMPKRSLKCSLSERVAGWRRNYLDSPKASGGLLQVLDEPGKDMVAMNCIRGSGGEQ